jgi:hypothetical protein
VESEEENVVAGRKRISTARAKNLDGARTDWFYLRRAPQPGRVFKLTPKALALCGCAPILILLNTGSVALMPSIKRGMVFLFVVFIARRGQGYTFVVMSVGFFLDGETMNNADQINNRAETARQIVGEMPVGELAKSMTGLKPKGACWYCNQPLDNVRRFCNKTCAEDYRTEEEAFRDSSK